MTRIEPLALSEVPGLEEIGQMYETIFGFVPNGLRIMARRPGIVEAFVHLRKAVMDPETSVVPLELKGLIGQISSKTAGCRYCQAHAAFGSERSGAASDRLEQLWSFETSDAFDEAERAALRFAILASSVPNGVSDAAFEAVRQYWGDGEIVEILAVVALYGFLNRWNDSLATPLEEPSASAARRLIGPQGWDIGRHGSGGE